MIIWLASYPRSGNTLTRTLLKTCFDLNSYADDPEKTGMFSEVGDVAGSRTYDTDWPAFYAHASASPELFLIKTHRPPMDDAPCIYIVRDGRASCWSYFKFMGSFQPQARRSLLQIVLGDDYYGDWSEHHAAWMNRPRGRLLQLRFDQLPDPSPETLRSIATFIGHHGAIKPWVNPMKELHERYPNFFREGRVEWTPPPQWTPSLDFVFWLRHGRLMRELGFPEPADHGIPEHARSLLAECSSLADERRLKNAELLHICEQRQTVIDDLKNACTQRQAVADDLRNVCEQRQAIIDDLKRVCDERLHALNGTSRRRARPAHKTIAVKLGRIWAKSRRAVLNGLFAHSHQLGVLRQYSPRPLRPPPVNTRPRPRPSHGFCILTPSFGQGEFIERTLRSVLDQGQPRVRYGVQDGGSRDATPDVLARYAGRLAYHDSRPDKGQASAINYGFSQMKPQDDEIMAWLNSDDLLLPGSLAYVESYFARHPEVDAVYGHRIIIDHDDNEVGRWFLPPHNINTLRWVDYVPQETLFWRTSAWRKTGGLNADFQFALDWEFLVKLEAAGFVIKRLPRFLGCFRVHPNQKTHLHIDSTGANEMDLIRSRQGLDPSLANLHVRKAVDRQTFESGLIQRLWSVGIKI